MLAAGHLNSQKNKNYNPSEADLKKFNIMKFKTLLFCFLLSYAGISQSNHTISNSGTSWVPSSLTIIVGDTVTWINTGGSHNVNGTTITFPNNPESFGNSVGAGFAVAFIWCRGF